MISTNFIRPRYRSVEACRSTWCKNRLDKIESRGAGIWEAIMLLENRETKFCAIYSRGSEKAGKWRIAELSLEKASRSIRNFAISSSTSQKMFEIYRAARFPEWALHRTARFEILFSLLNENVYEANTWKINWDKSARASTNFPMRRISGLRTTFREKMFSAHWLFLFEFIVCYMTSLTLCHVASDITICLIIIHI